MSKYTQRRARSILWFVAQPYGSLAASYKLIMFAFPKFHHFSSACDPSQFFCIESSCWCWWICVPSCVMDVFFENQDRCLTFSKMFYIASASYDRDWSWLLLLQEFYIKMHDSTFKAMRRFLPVTGMRSILYFRIVIIYLLSHSCSASGSVGTNMARSTDKI